MRYIKASLFYFCGRISKGLMIISSYLSHLTVALAQKCSRAFLWSGYLLLCNTNKKTSQGKVYFSFEFFELPVCVSYTCALKLYFTGGVSCLLWPGSMLPEPSRLNMIKGIFTRQVSLCFMWPPTVILVTLFYEPCKMPGQLQQLWNEHVLALETAHLKGAICRERF